MARDKWTPETPWFGPDKDTEASWPRYVCRNKNCKSYGKSHPNCHCGPPSLSTTYRNLEYAKGGLVHFCSFNESHGKECAYYADGGTVDHPPSTLGHAAIHHGLLGLLKDVGNSKLAESDKHIALFEDAKTQHSEHVSPRGEQFKKTIGNRIGTHIHEKDHGAMAERLHGHPLAGGVGKTNLEPILSRLGPEMIEKESHPEAFRGAVDYLHGAMRGDARLVESIGSLVGKSEAIIPDLKLRDILKSHLGEIQNNPEKLLEVGGNLGHYLPDHGSELGALAARAVDYLNTLKPQQTQAHPLDEPTPVDKMAEAKYHRALDVASHPLLVIQEVKNGTLVPADIVTLKTLYPGLHQSMVEKMGEQLITVKSTGEEIPYKQKQAMSLFLGQPLDATQTPEAMQAIIQSAGPKKKADGQEQKRASQVELKQVNKVDSLYALPTERREMNRNR